MAQSSAHCGAPRALPFGNPQTSVLRRRRRRQCLAFSFSENRILFDSRGDGAEFSFEQFILTVTFALENVVSLHSLKDCVVDRLLLYFLRKYKARNCPRVYHAKKAQHGAVFF